MATAVYIFGLEKYHPIVRPAILTGFLGYLFAVIGLLFDPRQPWHLPVPIVWSFGTLSVMFEVAWCVALYLDGALARVPPAGVRVARVEPGARARGQARPSR